MTAETFRTWWKLFMQRWDRAEQKELTAFYWAELQHLTDEEFTEAARRALRGSTYFPTVEELEELIGKHGLTAVEAWELVIPCLYGRTLLTDLPAQPRRVVLAMGGLRAIGAKENELHHRRREFMAMYLDVKDTENWKELTGG